MLEVSGAGAAESDDETEVSLELSIGGSYGKCGKQRAENGRVAVNGAAEQVEGESSGAADLCRRREIQAMRRLEAKRKREEKMRRLEEQQLEERARCRKMREDEEFLEDKSGRRKESSAAKITNYVNYGNEQKQCGPLKNGNLQAYAAAPASFRPYVHNGGVDNNAAQYSGNLNRNNVYPKVVGGNGSLERSSSAISDYRSTSGKGGSTSDTGSHSSYIRIAPNKDTSNQPEAGSTMDVPKDMIVLKETHCSADSKPASSKPDPGADASTSKPENPVSSPPKQQNAEEPPKVSGMSPALTQMPCVTTTGNGPNRKTITGFLYRYTNAAEVRIICVCHGTSFSPAEFVEHAGGTDISNPLRHITVVPSSLG